MKKRLLSVILLILASMMSFTACNGGKMQDLPHFNNILSDDDGNPVLEYNKELFYRNDLETAVADPSVIYIDDENSSEYGYFYMYGTSAEIGYVGYMSYRSKTLSDWEPMGVALRLEADDWGRRLFWAPEVIYDAEDGKYWMFFGAINDMRSDGLREMGVAYSTTPNGPFTLWTGNVPAGEYEDGTPYDSHRISRQTPSFDFTKIPVSHPLHTKNSLKVIDGSPFIDDDGQRYFYFVIDRGSPKGVNLEQYPQGDTSDIWGMKMINWYTPDYSTVAVITRNGKATIDGAKTLSEGASNEGPFLIKHKNTYYMTFSVFFYEDKGYQVRQATASSPLGPFTKIPITEGGTVVASEMNSDFTSGTGHHSFVTAGEERFIVYHAHLNRTTGRGSRAVAADRYSFVSNGNIDVIHVNGPTWSLQPLPEVSSTYKNIAGRATVTATNIEKFNIDVPFSRNSSVEYLTDGLIKSSTLDSFIHEFSASKTTTITLSFNTYYPVRAIMIYNSFEYNDAFMMVQEITLDYKKGDNEGTAVISRLGYDWNFLLGSFANYMSIGGASIAEFDELLVNKITITVPKAVANIDGENVPVDRVSIGEIVVLGK